MKKNAEVGQKGKPSSNHQIMRGRKPGVHRSKAEKRASKYPGRYE